eukprot:TRINITY_DN12883_c0_g1_i1.p1 TRINITY_DN12883_c0_g1~~TRINITY_DN12883_c0_g1_i1.p1  ORF type:complete len:235 (+),score=24.27 TRINITY_DN12883_c0_g1_i1:152-856(+)
MCIRDRYQRRVHGATAILICCNVVNQFFFGTKYKGRLMPLLLMTVVGSAIGIVTYAFVCFSLGARLTGFTYELMAMGCLFSGAVFLNAYLYSSSIIEGIYSCFRMDAEFYNEDNQDRNIQLYHLICGWCTNLGGWLSSTFYVYDWFKTPYPFATLNGIIYGIICGEILSLVIMLIVIVRSSEMKQLQSLHQVIAYSLKKKKKKKKKKKTPRLNLSFIQTNSPKKKHKKKNQQRR